MKDVNVKAALPLIWSANCSIVASVLSSTTARDFFVCFNKAFNSLLFSRRWLCGALRSSVFGKRKWTSKTKDGFPDYIYIYIYVCDSSKSSVVPMQQREKTASKRRREKLVSKGQCEISARFHRKDYDDFTITVFCSWDARVHTWKNIHVTHFDSEPYLLSLLTNGNSHCLNFNLEGGKNRAVRKSKLTYSFLIQVTVWPCSSVNLTRQAWNNGKV